MAVLSLKEVSYKYPSGFLAVDSVSVCAERGEMIAVIGQNGAGKTTLVKMCNGLLRPSLGDVFVENTNTKHLTTAQISRRVGYVFQNPDDQIFHSTVQGEVEFGPLMMKFPPEDTKALTEQALHLTGMQSYRRAHPYTLPLSMRKFVTIASVLAMNTPVVIFDEPTAGQDRQGISKLRAILSFLRSNGNTVIVITHDMEFAAENFRRLIVMADKKIIADSTPKDVFWRAQVLTTAKLAQPVVSRLCRELDLGGNVINTAEAVSAIVAAANERKCLT